MTRPDRETMRTLGLLSLVLTAVIVVGVNGESTE